MIQTSLNVIFRKTSDGQFYAYCAQIPTTTGIGDTEEKALERLQQNLHVDIISLRNSAIQEENKTGQIYKVLSYATTISTESPKETMSDSDEDITRKAVLIRGLLQSEDNITQYMESITKPCEKSFLRAFMENQENQNFTPVITRYREMFLTQNIRENGS